MSKITNDHLTRSGTGCFAAAPIWQQWASKGYNVTSILTSVLSAGVQKLCGLLLFRDKEVHYSRSSYWLALLVGVPYALASVSRLFALYYGK